MVQVPTFHGFFRNGQFMSSEEVIIPENVEVYITITGREIPQEYSVKQPNPEQQAALKFLSAIEGIKKDDFTEDDRESFEKWDNGDFKVQFEARLP